MIARLYRKRFVHRYDKEVGIPYYSYHDFPLLEQEAKEFINSKGIKIKYFFYYYQNYIKDKIILFCHGIGPGHTAYLKEIETLAKHGYKVLTLDYTGCGESGGKYLGSLNTPTRDVIDLMNYLNIKTPIVLVGHSLGGFTALNVINEMKCINKAVIISGFLDIKSLLSTAIKSKLILSRILKYEHKTEPNFFNLDIFEYLKSTHDKLLFIHSEDDQIVPYSISMKLVEEINNPSIKVIKVNNKKHNPNYSISAVNYMNEVFGKYTSLIANKKIKTDEEKTKFFKDVSLSKLVEQDINIFNQIFEFIDL